MLMLNNFMTSRSCSSGMPLMSFPSNFQECGLGNPLPGIQHENYFTGSKGLSILFWLVSPTNLQLFMFQSMAFNSRDIRAGKQLGRNSRIWCLSNEGGNELDAGFYGGACPVNKHRTLLCLTKDMVEESPKD